MRKRRLTPLQRGRIRQQRRETIYKMQKKRHGAVRCFVCKQPVSPEDASLEHITPRSKGGTDDMANLAISHTACNARRGNGGGEA